MSGPVKHDQTARHVRAHRTPDLCQIVRHAPSTAEGVPVPRPFHSAVQEAMAHAFGADTLLADVDPSSRAADETRARASPGEKVNFPEA